LHGGEGTRLRPLTYSGPKQLIPVANKPVSQYALEDMLSCGIREIAIVLGETFPDLVRKYYGDGSKFGANITYIYQGKALGIAHAVSLCKDYVGEDSFVVFLGDNMFQNGISRYAESFLKTNPDALILLKDVEDVSRFGVAQLGVNNKLIKVVEKPKQPPSNFAIVGVYFFKPTVFDAIKELKPSWRNELEITDAIQIMIDKGNDVRCSFVEGWWVDTGKKDDILQVNALILDERMTRDVRGCL
jgi:glucose-1-phosphate thymidylyltransferase